MTKSCVILFHHLALLLHMRWMGLARMSWVGFLGGIVNIENRPTYRVKRLLAQVAQVKSMC